MAKWSSHITFVGLFLVRFYLWFGIGWFALPHPCVFLRRRVLRFVVFCFMSGRFDGLFVIGGGGWGEGIAHSQSQQARGGGGGRGFGFGFFFFYVDLVVCLLFFVYWGVFLVLFMLIHTLWLGFFVAV